MKMLFVLDEKEIRTPVRRREVQDYGAAPLVQLDRLLSGPSPAAASQGGGNGLRPC